MPPKQTSTTIHIIQIIGVVITRFPPIGKHSKEVPANLAMTSSISRGFLIENLLFSLGDGWLVVAVRRSRSNHCDQVMGLFTLLHFVGRAEKPTRRHTDGKQTTNRQTE